MQSDGDNSMPEKLWCAFSLSEAPNLRDRSKKTEKIKYALSRVLILRLEQVNIGRGLAALGEK
jgi:hypothetical protein